MTVPVAEQRNQYVAVASQTTFTYTFEIMEATDLNVYQVPSGSTPDDTLYKLVYNTDYTVTGVGSSSGGTIVLTTGATVGDLITIEGNAPVERTTSFTPGGLIRAEDLNTEFDNLTLIAQKQQTQIDETIPKYQQCAEIEDADLHLPLLPAGTTWRKSDDGTKIQTVSLPDGDVAGNLNTYVTMTDETGNLPNSQPLANIGTGFIANIPGSTQIVARTLLGTTNQITMTNGDGVSGNTTVAITDNPIIPGTAGMGIPQGTTAQRVIPSSNIGFRYNTSLSELEYYNGSTWKQIESSGILFLPLAGGTMSGNIDMGGTNKVTNAAAPTLGSDYTTKDYVDNIVQNVQLACNYATTTELTGWTYDNGPGNDGIGATLTAPTTGLFQIDGVTPSTGDRILIKSQSTQLQNGVYVVTTNLLAANGILTRASDYDQSSQMQAGDIFAVVSGSTLAATSWMMSQTSSITVGTTAITFTQMSNTGALLKANNLSDLTNVTAAQQNMGVEVGVDVQAYNINLDIVSSPNANAVLLSNNSSQATWSAPLTNGQLLIGSTGGQPTPANLIAGANITITNGPGTITIDSSASGTTNYSDLFLLMGG